ncbi:uncharacterized protein XM38_000860 [Halomicronema hongdechloris C2206]|uniref:Peptidase C1A papain C-terminal domain-containing protein n=1 Tax=Halomicronema hongdechloris C2206 TaxID=1641165 RepID=A0A1Z3HFU8_9CYAN|nr:C1 family peptidase [Halomicronema hongdechloris]ASC69160.1 uncharacterized protein XM38_000860 [Halomicronema hongdechloris C2206]
MGNMGTGWTPDQIDFQDYTLRHNKIHALVKQIQTFRRCVELLESFETFLNKLPDAQSAPGFLGWLLGNSPGALGKQALLETSTGLRQDLEIILQDMVSGIDLIVAEPVLDSPSDLDRLRPLPPPLSLAVLEALQDCDIVTSSDGGQGSRDYQDAGLRSIRHVLGHLTPLGQYGQSQQLKSAMVDLVKQGQPQAAAESPRPENVIRINPDTMYDLQVNPASRASLRLPLTMALVDELKGPQEQYYVLPSIVDLSYWCGAVKQQGSRNSCTSHAIASLIEYFQTKSFGKASTSSVRFLYKVTRRLGELSQPQRQYLQGLLRDGVAEKSDDQAFSAFMDTITAFNTDDHTRVQEIQKRVADGQVQAFVDHAFDGGASIRQTLKAMRLFGLPPGKYWPYTVEFPDFDEEPPQFCYAFAQNYQAVKYFRLDYFGDTAQPSGSGEYGEAPAPEASPQSVAGRVVLTQIKAVLAAGFPAVFGFPYDAANDHPYPAADGSQAPINSSNGMIKLPEDLDTFKRTLREMRQGSQDAMTVSSQTAIRGHAVMAVGYDDAREAFLIQNSWGTEWGNQGYGWLAYDYVLHGLATDWWSLLNAEWVEAGQFGLDAKLGGTQQVPKAFG